MLCSSRRGHASASQLHEGGATRVLARGRGRHRRRPSVRRVFTLEGDDRPTAHLISSVRCGTGDLSTQTASGTARPRSDHRIRDLGRVWHSSSAGFSRHQRSTTVSRHRPRPVPRATWRPRSIVWESGGVKVALAPPGGPSRIEPGDVGERLDVEIRRHQPHAAKLDVTASATPTCAQTLRTLHRARASSGAPCAGRGARAYRRCGSTSASATRSGRPALVVQRGAGARSARWCADDRPFTRAQAVIACGRPCRPPRAVESCGCAPASRRAARWNGRVSAHAPRPRRRPRRPRPQHPRSPTPPPG